MAESPFHLPLDRAAFVAALHKGQGRALLHLRQFGSAGLDDTIVDAVLHDRAFDPQCEDERTDWLVELIDASDSPEALAESIVAQLPETTECFWSATQRARIARKFAARGHEPARSALYALLRPGPGSDDIVAAHDIISLDGSDGLIHIAEFVGQCLQSDVSFRAGDLPLVWFDEEHGGGAGRRILDRLADDRPRIAIYLAAIDGSVDGGRANLAYRSLDNLRLDAPGYGDSVARLGAISAAEVLERVRSEGEGAARWEYSLASWGRQASDEDLAQIAEALAIEDNAARLCKLLSVFARRETPQLDLRWLRFAHHPDQEVRRKAYMALRHYAHEVLRRLAQSRLESGRIFEGELELFAKNYQHGDGLRIARALAAPSDRNVLHGMMLDLLYVAEANLSDDFKQAMLFVYEQSPCSNCRGSAVKLLQELQIAPAWLRDECRHDASSEIREIVAATSLEG